MTHTISYHNAYPIGRVNYLDRVRNSYYSEASNGFEKIKISLDYHPGDTITFEWEDHGMCMTTRAAASMLCEKISGKTLREAIDFSSKDMLKMLEGEPNCILLPWHALQEGLLECLLDVRKSIF